MKFGAALDSIRAGYKAARHSWWDNGDLRYIALQTPDEHSKMSQPYIYVGGPEGARGPWNPTHDDLLAADWSVDHK